MNDDSIKFKYEDSLIFKNMDACAIGMPCGIGFK